MPRNLDLFDQPGAREQAGERQTDIEDLIAERPSCDAVDEANRLKQADPAHNYTVGAA